MGYVRCQDLKKSFDSPDQLLMVIRAPPETQMQVLEPSKVSPERSFATLPRRPRVSPVCPPACAQGFEMSLKSTQGPIDVFLCPEDSSGACSPVTGSSPSKANADPSLVPPVAKPADQPKARDASPALEENSSSPASTSSTVTAASQQDPSSLVIGSDSGEFPLKELGSRGTSKRVVFASRSWRIVMVVQTRTLLHQQEGPPLHTSLVSSCSSPLLFVAGGVWPLGFCKVLKAILIVTGML